MLSEAIYKVFVSSTFQDLREERAEVQKALLKINCLPVGMELFPAADDETWDFIKTQIDDADYYVVLVAGRYGSLASTGISFTEMEYDYAREQDIPSIGFVHADRSTIPSGKVDNDPHLITKLDEFIKKIKTRPIREFITPHQLATEVITSFIDLKRTKPRVGFVRTNQAVEYKKYAELLERATELENRLATLKHQSQQPFSTYDEVAVANSSRAITWSDIFLAVASSVLESALEENIIVQVNNSFTELLPPDTQMLVAVIREKLFALNLIDVFTEQVTYTDFRGHVHSRSTPAWKLTEYGRRQFSLLRHFK